MSLWTPSGEHPVAEKPPPAAEPAAEKPPPAAEPVDVEEIRRQLADSPAEVVVANHCYGLFELAAVYLSQSPPRLPQAQLAIDALGCLIDGLGDRLGDARSPLQEALAQIRLAYVELGP